MKKIFIIFLFISISHAKSLLILNTNPAANDDFKCSDLTRFHDKCVSSWMYKYNLRNCKMAYIKDFTEILAWALNRHLRGLTNDSSCEGIKDDVLHAMKKLRSSREKIYYRGVRPFPQLLSLKSGDCFEDRGYTSITTSIEVARKFADIKDAYTAHIMMIDTEKSKKIGGRSKYDHEKESILLPNTTLKLDRVEIKENEDYRYFGIESRKRIINYYFRDVEREECEAIIR